MKQLQLIILDTIEEMEKMDTLKTDEVGYKGYFEILKNIKNTITRIENLQENTKKKNVCELCDSINIMLFEFISKSEFIEIYNYLKGIELVLSYL